MRRFAHRKNSRIGPSVRRQASIVLKFPVPENKAYLPSGVVSCDQSKSASVSGDREFTLFLTCGALRIVLVCLRLLR